MFKVGDKIVYPMHGAGVVEAIEEREILGQRKQYYILRLSFGEMQLMVPVDNAQAVGLRRVIGDEDVEEVLRVLGSGNTRVPSNWSHRYRAHLEKIKTGDIYEVAEVVRNLALRDRERGLSTGERKMLDSARQILVSELVLAKNIRESQAWAMVEKALA